MGEFSELLKPGEWELRSIEVVRTEVQVPEGGQFEKRRLEASALQTSVTQVEGSHAAIMVAAAHARPAAAVRAGPPRPEGNGRVIGGDEGSFQPEQRRRLIRQAWNWRRAGGAVAGVSPGGREQRAGCDREVDLQEQLRYCLPRPVLGHGSGHIIGSYRWPLHWLGWDFLAGELLLLFGEESFSPFCLSPYWLLVTVKVANMHGSVSRDNLASMFYL